MEENVSTQVEMSAALGTLATCSSTAYMCVARYRDSTTRSTVQ